jgi:outer membrane receptor for ferrienterochelin and colicins
MVFSCHSDTYNKYDYLEKLDERQLNYSNAYLNPRVVGNFSLGRMQEVVAGVEYFHESLLTDMFAYGELLDKRASSTVVFLQDEIRPLEDLSIIAGLRGGYHSAFGSYFNPKLSLMYKLNPLSLRLNYANGYRSPSLKELYMNWDHLDMFMIMGNEDLEPETNNYYSASAEYTRGRLNASLNAYLNRFKNKIEGQWAEDQTIYRYMNVSESSLRGIEFLARVKILTPLYLKGGYSYVNDENRQEGVRLSSVSPHTANLQLEYRLARPRYQLTVNLSGKYIGAKDYLVMEEIESGGEVVEAWYAVHYDPYSIWRISVENRFNRALSLVAGVENLFDYTAGMVTFNTSVLPGRRYFLKMELSIDRLWKNIRNQ